MRDKANGKGVEKRGYEQEKSGELKYVQVKEGKGKIYIYIVRCRVDRWVQNRLG